MKFYIKNMVCPRCVAAVTQIFKGLDLEPESITLGEAETKKEAGPEQLVLLRERLKEQGFKLLGDTKDMVVERIKSVIINHIHHSDGGAVVFSELLASELHKDYSGLSKLFSAHEGITIEHFIILQKTEKVKELLLYNQLTLSEIAHKLGYSSVSHLSAQFRKVTGITPTEFRKSGANSRKPLDAVSKNL
ncbi:AraC family transcriptional regulator [Flavobacterium sp. D11R37]|uniref:helix-turn-helix domain-containing protein n=1 Tax=Flavobacterium coralii TaxID=2838017 RepID=UPI001CA6B892|nr:AraC family transcriptional regulator [Flavobacterium coralii]MBY8961441.1 AraC family transcriptional regulator [Flavobacterium coralii]